MTYRYLKIFRWQIPLFHEYEAGALIGWTGVTIHQIWSRTLRNPERNGTLGGARLTHLGHLICEGKVDGILPGRDFGFNTRYPHGLLHTSQFRLESSLPIAYVAFSRWEPDQP
jgi:hypothetical protein